MKVTMATKNKTQPTPQQTHRSSAQTHQSSVITLKLTQPISTLRISIHASPTKPHPSQAALRFMLSKTTTNLHLTPLTAKDRGPSFCSLLAFTGVSDSVSDDDRPNAIIALPLQTHPFTITSSIPNHCSQKR